MSLRNLVLYTVVAAVLAGSVFTVASPALAQQTSFAKGASVLSPKIALEQETELTVLPAANDDTLSLENRVKANESLAERFYAHLASIYTTPPLSEASATSENAVEADAVAFGQEPVLQAVAAVALEEEVQQVIKARAAARRAAALAAKIESMKTGSAGQLTGIYVQNSFAMNSGEFWQFGMAASHGSLGLLAHNYAGGGNFFSLRVGSVINLVYGDGSTRKFQVTKIRRFEALQPNSPTSQFIDLDRGGGKQSTAKVFHQIYNSSNPLVLQTCIAKNGVSTWGRLFVIAVPIS